MSFELDLEYPFEYDIRIDGVEDPEALAMRLTIQKIKGVSMSLELS